MPLNDVCSVHLPYCIKREDDGTYVIVNRESKPLGFKTREDINYAAYPIRVKLRGLRAATAAKISFNGSRKSNVIYLYDDGTNPARGPKHMAAYLQRLAHLAKLKC